jgi:hypothetical protein
MTRHECSFTFHIIANKGNAMSLSQELKAIVAELDALNAPDESYRARFSTFVKKPLRKGETWRDRLIAWSENA